MTENSPAISIRAQELFARSQRVSHTFTDRVFAVLMVLQWAAAVGAACIFSPTTWAGEQSWVHPHVWWAFGMGGLLAALPIFCMLTKPGSKLTRLAIAGAQTSFSALLIHLTGGRIETHFHVFGSLAFLAFYRDFSVLLLATVIVAVDHFVRGVWFPASVFGVASTSPYRWLEHAGWVIFEDVFLFLTIRRGLAESRLAAHRLAVVEASHEIVEQQVAARTTELVAANAAATEALRAKGEFLTNMSHEIRTPMGAIIGFADMLLDPAQTPAERVEAVQTIRRNGTHLLTIINDILDISKIEAGKLTVEMIPTDPTQLLEEVCSLMQVRAVQKGLNLKHTVTGPYPRSIHTDPVRLRQILINLVGNSLKFTNDGTVTIHTTFSEHPTPRLKFHVHDSGIGMTEEQIARLFRPFSQADYSTTRKYGGTGLGLSISKRLAEALGGGITVVSTPGKGSTFTLEIEVGEVQGVSTVWHDREQRKRYDPDQPLPRLEGVRILLAEDGVDNQRLFTLFLQRAGASFTLAEDGQSAVDCIVNAANAGQPYDIVLMDMQMPVLDGYGAASLLRAKGFDVPIIALTAHAMVGDREKCIQAGCTDYLTKPVECVKLIQTCDRWRRFQQQRRNAAA